MPKDVQKAFRTLLDIQRKNYTVDAAVVEAINALRSMDASILNDQGKVDSMFVSLIGLEYAQIWEENRAVILNEIKLKIGNDMSTWSTSDLPVLQQIVKKKQQEKAKKEKLDGTKNAVRTMEDDVLRKRVAAFLDAHPEYCDAFTH